MKIKPLKEEPCQKCLLLRSALARTCDILRERKVRSVIVKEQRKGGGGCVKFYEEVMSEASNAMQQSPAWHRVNK